MQDISMLFLSIATALCSVFEKLERQMKRIEVED